jgi:multisubunit Na+/H+ antiporter MnhG subunit
VAASKENRLVAASAMGWVGVSSFVLFLLCWVLGLADVWRMLALLFAICMITPSNLIWQRH